MSERPSSPSFGAWRLWVALALAMSGLMVSATLLLEHHGRTTASAIVDSVCGPEDDSGCHAVDQSPWSEIGGVSLAALGMLFYASLGAALILALAAPEARPTGAALALALCVLGLLADAGLLAIQAFAVKAYCSLCLVTYAVTLAAAIVLFRARAHLLHARSLVAAPAQRLLVAAWILSSGLAVTATAAAEWGLAVKPPAFDAGDEEPANRLSPAEARAEVERLRRVLSSPEELEAYFTQKSLRELESNPRHEIDLEGLQVAGPRDAPVLVLIYSDFLCPWCARLAAWLGQYVPSTGGQVAAAFKSYPLDRACNPELRRTVHEGACHLARGALCAEAQGRFWAYHDQAFNAGLERATAEDAERLAGGVGLDVARFRRCLDAPETAERLARQIEEARRVGVEGTPTLLVNGRLLPRPADLPLAVQRITQHGAITQE